MTDTARIYVASLSDYNNGHLHGEWIDVDQSAEEINEAIQAMLKKSKRPGAEEWAIHDYELPGGIKISEYESIDTVAALGQALGQADDADAFAAWYADCLTTPDPDVNDADALLGRFRDAYMGSADTFKDWVMSNDTDVLGIDQIARFIKDAEERDYFGGPKNPYSELFETLTNNIDWDMVARDQESNYTIARVGGTTYVFSS